MNEKKGSVYHDENSDIPGVIIKGNGFEFGLYKEEEGDYTFTFKKGGQSFSVTVGEQELEYEIDMY